MADKVRKDPKGRKLQTGETYDSKTGRYRYTYTDAYGARRSVYSWTLTSKDTVPRGKKQKKGQSLRERKETLRLELAEQMDLNEGKMTVCQLMERYIALRSPEVRENTRKGYRTQLNFMRENPFGKKKINEINQTEAEEWFTELNSKHGKSYSTLHTLRGILRPAFNMAKRNRWVRDNPFDFSMLKKRYGGTKTRDALSRSDMRRFLDFLRTHPHYNRYFYGTFILFNTGLRISEFCGLTPEDIDFENHVIHVRRQLLRVHDGSTNKYYIEEPKSDNGVRDVPMLADVETAFKEVMKARPQLPKEVVVWNENHTESASGFLWLDKNQHYEVAQHWSNHLRWATNRFNLTYKDEIPSVMPHVCRHTFCSNCASIGMSPKTLQIIMGHSSIEFTLNVYTHLEPGDVKGQFLELYGNKSYEFYSLDRVPTTVALSQDEEDEEDDEGEPDFDEAPDDDDEADWN